jgi:hypothetical protein
VWRGEREERGTREGGGRVEETKREGEGDAEEAIAGSAQQAGCVGP